MIEVSDILLILPDLPRDRMNPYFGSLENDTFDGCVYTSPEDGSHCIAGEVMSRLGLPLPEIDSSKNNMGFYDLVDTTKGYDFSTSAIKFLGSLQTRADSMLRPWGENIDLVVEAYEMEHRDDEAMV